MALTRICAEVVSEINKQAVFTVFCEWPDHRPIAAGEKGHVHLRNISLNTDGPNPNISFHFYVSMEYRFKYGYDYCIVQGSHSIDLPPGIRMCGCAQTDPLSYTAACEDISLGARGVIRSTVTINFRLLTCEYRIVTVQCIEGA